MSRITFSAAKTLLAPTISSAGPSDALVGQTINYVSERLINSGKWKGQTFTALLTPFKQADGTFAVSTPAEVESIEKVILIDPTSANNNRSEIVSIQSQWYQFSENGMGLFPTNYSGDTQVIRLGDGYPTPIDTFNYATLVVSGFATAPIIVNGDLIINPADLPYHFAANYSISSLVFSALTDGVVNFQSPIGTTIFTFDPLVVNNVPNFQRYRIVGQYPEGRQVYALCTRAYVPLIGDTDIVFPSNLNALRLGCRALVYEEANDLERAQVYWSAAIKCLQDELEAFQGDATLTEIQVQSKAFMKFHNLL